MATEKQIEANRQNSLKSTGPKTSEGKSTIAQNAIKHGFLSCQSLIKGESQADFDLHLERIFSEFNPAGPIETHYVGRMVTISWRLLRANRLQTAAINSLQNSHKNSAVRHLDAILKPKKDDSPPPHDLELGDVTVKDFANAKVIDNLLMHERRLENSLYKTIQEVQRLKLIKKIGIYK